MAKLSSLVARLLALVGTTLALTGCVTDGRSPLAFLTTHPTPIEVVASTGEANLDDEGEEEEEGSDPLDGWLQAYLYRSPDYQLSLPQRRNRLSEALKTAFDLRGTPYRMGGATEQGLDCSGLVWVSFASAGIRLPRTSQEQFYATKRIDRAALQPGDLVFFKTGRSKKREIDHVGIYVGNGNFLHAPRRGKAVSIASLSESYWDSRYRGAGRVLGSGDDGEAAEPVEMVGLTLTSSGGKPLAPRFDASPEPAARSVARSRVASATQPNRAASARVTARTTASSSRPANGAALSASRKGGSVATAKPSVIPNHTSKSVASKPSPAPAPAVQKKARESQRLASHP